MTVALASYLTTVLLDRPGGLWLLSDPVGSSSAIDYNANIGGPKVPGTKNGTVTFGVAGPPQLQPALSAATFDGSTGWIQIPAASPWTFLSGTQGWSLEVSAALLAATINSRGVFDVTSPVASPNITGLRILSNASTGAWLGQRFINGSASSSLIGSTPTVGTWYLLDLVWDGANLILYVNGSSVSSTPDTTAWTAGVTPVASIANSPEVGTRQFNGSIFGAAFFPYALTPTQVAAHFQAWQTGPADIYLPFPPGFQPWQLPGPVGGISAWASEIYPGGGLGQPPLFGQQIVDAVVLGPPAIKYWLLGSAVQPSA